MAAAINGVAHIQLTINNAEQGLPFWEKLCHFLGMETLIRNQETVYCIGGRTGILVRATPPGKQTRPFDQDTSGLHHFCLRAREREDVDRIFNYVDRELQARIIHGPEDGSRFAPGYYSMLFEDPDGIRVEINHVPGRGHFGRGGRLGEGGQGPANQYGEDGLTDR